MCGAAAFFVRMMCAVVVGSGYRPKARRESTYHLQPSVSFDHLKLIHVQFHVMKQIRAGQNEASGPTRSS